MSALIAWIGVQETVAGIRSPSSGRWKRATRLLHPLLVLIMVAPAEGASVAVPAVARSAFCGPPQTVLEFALQGTLRKQVS